MFKIIYFWLLFKFTFLVSFGGEFVEDEKKVELAEEAFPFHELGKEDNYSTDVQEDENLSTLSELLRSNIEQWRLAETQLSDPEINLAMPGISTPLQQLSMTLEILGNIYITQGDLVKARDTLEKACPLIELIASPSIDDVFSVPAAEDSSHSRISPPQSQKHVDQFRHCIVQLKDVYTQLSLSPSDAMDLSNHGTDRLMAVRSPYLRLRAEFEFRKFLKDIVTALETESESLYLNAKHDIQRELQDFVQRYVHDYNGKIPTLLDIFERTISDTPGDISDTVIANLQDLMDESMDVVFKQVWENSSSQRFHNPYHRSRTKDSESHSLPSTAQTLSPSMTGSTPLSRGPSLAAAPAPGVSSPSTLEPVIHGPDSVILAEESELVRQDTVVTDMIQCLQAGNRDCTKLPFPNSKDLQRVMDALMSQKIASSLSIPPDGALFNEDGSLNKNILHQINQALPLDKRKPSPSIGAAHSSDSSDSGSNGQLKQASAGRKAGLKKRQKRSKSKADEEDEGNGDSFDRVFNHSFMHSEEGSVVVDVDLSPDGVNANDTDSKSAVKTGSTRGGFSRKPTPVIPNATAYAPPPALQMNLVFWQWVRMQPPQPTPLANVKVEAPSPAKTATGNSQSSSSHSGRNDGLRLNSETAGALFESSTTAGQNSAPRAAVSNVRANNASIFALVFSVIALCLGVAYLNYSQQSSSSLRRKPKRTPKRTFSQHVEDSVEYLVQVSQEVVYPFLCYLIKQLVGLFVNAYSKMIEYLSRKAVPATTAKDGSNTTSNSKNSKGNSVIAPIGNGSGSAGKKSGNSTNDSVNGVATSISRNKASVVPVTVSNTGDAPPNPVLTSILSTSSTSSNTSTGSSKSSKKKSPLDASGDSPITSGQSSSSADVEPGSKSKQVRFTKDTAPAAPHSAPSVTPPVAQSEASDTSKTTKLPSHVKSSEVPLSKKTNSGNTVSTPAQSTPAYSTSTKSTAKTASTLPNGTTNKASSIAKKSTPPVTSGNSSVSSVSAVGKSNAINDNGSANNKNSPKSVVVPTPPSNVNAQAASIAATVPASKKKLKVATTVPPKTAGLTKIADASSTQENAWKMVGGKSESMSPRSMNTEASVDSYDELLHHMKQTTVDSISVDEDEEKSKRENGLTNKSGEKNDKSRKKSVNVPKAGNKPFPYPSPIIIGATPPIALAPPCDISPHSALRIAPGISSGSYAINNTGTSSNSSTATSPSSSSPGSTPIAAMTLKLSPKVSAMVNAIPELEKAPSDIAPGLSASLLPPAVVSNVDSTVNDDLINSGNSYPRVLSDSLLVALNESSSESLNSVPALGGLGLLSASNRLSDASAGSGGGDGSGSGNIDDSDINFYEASPMFPLQNLDGFNTAGGLHNNTTSPPRATAYGLGQGNSTANQQRLSSGGGAPAKSTGGNVNSSDGDIFVQEFFSDLNKDSPVFCSANYPTSTPPGMSSRGMGVPSRINESDSAPYSDFPRRGLGESLGDFDFSSQSNLGERENLDGVGGIGYGLFGNRHSNSFRRESEQQDRDAEEAFWKKNTQNSKMLLGSSLLDDDGDDDDMFHFASQGENLDNDFFSSENDKYDDLLQPSRWHDDRSSRQEGVGGGRGRVNDVGLSHGAPPGFNMSVDKNSLDHSMESSINSNELSRDLLSYAPQNRSDTRMGGGHAGDEGSMMSHEQLPHVHSAGPHLRHSLDIHDTDNGSQSQDIVTLTFTVRCAVDFRHPMQVASVCMASSLFGVWSIDQALPMRRSVGTDDVFGINVEVPSYLPHFTFKYIITDMDGKMWMEHGGPVVINVSKRLQLEQRQKGRHSQPDSGPVLHQEDMLMSYVSIPPGPFLYGNGN